MGHVDPNHATTEVRLNACTLFNQILYSFYTRINQLRHIINSDGFKALVDSGSTHCFVDPRFIPTNNLIIHSIPNPTPLFDGVIISLRPIDTPL